MNSAELLTRYGAGAEEAFEELVRRHADLVFSVAKRRLGSAALAEEATQVVFMRLASSKPRLGSEPALLGWLHRTALHVSIDQVRSETRRRIREEKSMQTVATAEEPSWEEIVPLLDEALDRLKDEERAILLLRFFERKPFAEVGAEFSISEDAAKMRVARALDKMRELLAAQKVPCTAAVLGALLLRNAVEAAPVNIAATMHAWLPVLPSVAPGLRISTKGVLIGAGSLLLMGTLLVSSLWRPGESLELAAQVSSEVPLDSAAIEKPSESRNGVGGAQRKFDPVTTRSILSLLDSDTGAPIAAGRMHMAYFYDGGVAEVHKSVSDAEGEIAIPFPDREGDPFANIFVTAEGYLPKVWSYRGTVPKRYEIKLEPALTFAGQVVDEEGKPVSQVKVTMACYAFEMDPRKEENVAFNSPDVASTTDEAGSFRLPFVPRELPARPNEERKVRISLTAAGFEVTQTNFPAPLSARNDLKLVIRRGVMVTGRVSDPEGRPVAKVKVREVHNFGQRKIRTVTDDEGVFTLDGVWRLPSEKQVRVVVEPEDWACQEKTITIGARTNVVNFTLAKSPVFRAVVKDEEGRPLADVTVRTDSDSDGIRKYEWLDKTNIDGGVEWSSAPAEPTLFWFEKVGYKTIRDMELTPDGSTVLIVLRRAASDPPER